ncbi:MAG: type I-B CRISPR-associated protein Cas5 [Tissierellia bacterium]|nr:type I-B CRISPR-associated protein Cas5 [Tissierellia bacterium]
MNFKKAFYFELSGKTAFFKKPDVNTYAYFTYNNIHKIALLGMLGAILGLQGHKSKEKEQEYPEFYDKLKGLKIAVIPEGKKGIFSKKIQTFNNSVGYACKEEGGNLIIREQWLEEPKWQIYLLNNGDVDSELYQKLVNFLLTHQTIYLPYLGTNDHPALIKNPQEVFLEKNSCDHFDSLFLKEKVELDEYETYDGNVIYLFQEFLPYAFQPYYNFYKYKEIMLTNCLVLNMDQLSEAYMHENRSLFFY